MILSVITVPVAGMQAIARDFFFSSIGSRDNNLSGSLTLFLRLYAFCLSVCLSPFLIILSGGERNRRPQIN